MSKWIEFTEESPAENTRRWTVRSVNGGSILGWIQWFGRWRKYAFNPATQTAFEEDCLRDIAEFIEARTREHKETHHA